jgi:hypothetical protein
MVDVTDLAKERERLIKQKIGKRVGQILDDFYEYDEKVVGYLVINYLSSRLSEEEYEELINHEFEFIHEDKDD